MDLFQEFANEVVVYKIRSIWFEVSKLYNELGSKYDITLSMGFTLLTIDDKTGTPVTKIAPRMGMEPNSLSRLLKSMEEKGLIYRRRDDLDKRQVYICVTKKGKKLQKVSARAVFLLNQELVQDIPQDKLVTFFEVLSAISTSIDSSKKGLRLADLSQPIRQ